MKVVILFPVTLLSSLLLFVQVTTVDRYQGQQNDYIILSLVRTKTVGHIRDVRRLVVAMSRARLGLYVLARVSLFQNCFELRPAFSQVSRTSHILSIQGTTGSFATLALGLFRVALRANKASSRFALCLTQFGHDLVFT